MQSCPSKGLSKSLSILLPIALFVGGCGDGTLTDPLGDRGLTVATAQSLDPQARMEFALERYERDGSRENLHTLHLAKAEYMRYRLEQERLLRFDAPRLFTVNAAVDQGWSGGTTEWTYAWTGSVAIPDNRTIDVTQTLPGHGTILDVDLEVTELRHPWTVDVGVRLVAPDGTTFSRLFWANPAAWSVPGYPGGDPIDILGTYFDDEAQYSITLWDRGAVNPFTGPFKPWAEYYLAGTTPKPIFAPLAGFDGQDMFGVWTLRVDDFERVDEGVLHAWRMVVTVQGAPLTSGVVNVAYSGTPTGIGTGGSYTWTVVAGTLPAGLTLKSNTGEISGTPTAPGTSTFTIQGVPNNGAATIASSSMSLTINMPLVATAPTSLPDGRVGTAYTAPQLSAAGGGGGYVWSSSTLPAGVTLSADGFLGGTPTVAGTHNFTVTVTSADGQTRTVALTLTVANLPLAITTASPMVAVAGQPFSQALQAVGGGGGYAWTLTGDLPQGLAFQGGTVSGTAQSADEKTVTVTVTSADLSTVSMPLTVRVTDSSEPLTIVTASPLGGGVRLQPYSASLDASGKDRNYTWSLVGGTLPPGLSLGAAGSISGTPTLAGAYAFTVRVQAGFGDPVDGSFTLEVVNPPVTITTGSSLAGVWNAPYSSTLQAEGGAGAGTYAWSHVGGTLPTGLTLDADGRLHGTPVQAGSSTFTVQAISGLGEADPYARSVSQSFTFTVRYPAVVITTSSLPVGGTGEAYPATTLRATGGNDVYAWSITEGTLPAGLTLAPSTGVISGMPTDPGRADFTVTATSGSGGDAVTASKALSIAVLLKVPLDVSHCADGAYLGFGFHTEAQCVRYVESGYAMDSRIGQFPDLVLTDALLPDAVTEAPYSHTFTATGGADNADSYLTWAGHNLPGWLALDADLGTLSGTPLIAGRYEFSIAVTSYPVAEPTSKDFTLTVAWLGAPPSDNVCARGVWAEYNFNSEVQCRRFVSTGMDSREGQFPDPVVTTTSLPNGKPGVPYTATFTATGGADNPGSVYEWAVGGLPAGLTLDVVAGTISGTPTVEGTYVLSVSVTSIDAITGYREASAPLGLSLVIANRLDPATKEDCMKDGWKNYGFSNQGQCVTFVETGKDSR